ncbi:hypothetical protein [Paraburkholderia caffeinilytica]|uniref:hypothetical protein n=1 Tax=Paraburkholderia caffeinilytica TaxID=1761016 RepID=UPI003DA1398B
MKRRFRFLLKPCISLLFSLALGLAANPVSAHAKGGNTEPSAHDLKDVLGSVGAEADDGRIELLLLEVKGKDITELMTSDRERLASH